jgi:hypothetical protein
MFLLDLHLFSKLHLIFGDQSFKFILFMFPVFILIISLIFLFLSLLINYCAIVFKLMSKFLLVLQQKLVIKIDVAIIHLCQMFMNASNFEYYQRHEISAQHFKLVLLLLLIHL